MAHYEGEVRVEWLRHAGEDRSMKLLEEFAFVDDRGVRWVAPAGSIIDGASIPEMLWSAANGTPYVGIMVPSAPVPIGGALVYVPTDWVTPADGGVEALMNVYISMGVVPPPDVVAAVKRHEEKRGEEKQGQKAPNAHDKRARDTASEH